MCRCFGIVAGADEEVVTQNDLFDALTDPDPESAGYDLRDQPRPFGEDLPVQVLTNVYVSFLGHIDDERLEFETHLVVGHRWNDPRLNFANANGLNQTQVAAFREVEGESWFADNMWTPNIFVENEQSSQVMELVRENVFVAIDRGGNVKMSYRVFANVLCDMDLRRFPHDDQICFIKFESCA